LSAATLSCAVNCLRSFFMESPPHGFYTNPREKTLQIQGRQNTVLTATRSMEVRGTTSSTVGNGGIR
jgi:hypothetical protein